MDKFLERYNFPRLNQEEIDKMRKLGFGLSWWLR